MLAMQMQLQQTQWLDAAALADLQAQQLQELLRHARAQVPYWRERLPEAGGDSPLEHLRRLPLLGRGDVQAAGVSLRALSLPPSHGQARPGATSGSTGTPVAFWSSDLAAFFTEVCSVRDHLWHGRDMNSVLLSIRDAEPARLPGWYLDAGGSPLLSTGPCVVQPIRESIEQQAKVLRELRPAYLQTHATNLGALAKYWLRVGWPPPGLREARSFAEVLTEETRELVREAWQVEVSDVYSTQECGYLALQCPLSGRYHVQSEVALMEVLDEQGRACAPGEVGQVVVTALHNFAMPLLRYRIGDFAEVGPPCPCGRGLPVLSRILGRVRNMLLLPDGQQRWPMIGYAFRGLDSVRQIQVAQTGREDIEVRLVSTRVLTAAEEAQLRSGAVERLGFAFRVSIRYCDAIPRGPGGKYEEFRSELPAA